MNRSALAAAIVILPVAGLIMLAQPALADIGGKCQGKGKVCLYQDVEYNSDSSEDHWANFATSDSNFNNNHWYDKNGIETNDGLNDEATSLKNRRGCTIVLYRNRNYGGTSTSFPSGDDDAYLGDDPVGSNQASSLEITC